MKLEGYMKWCEVLKGCIKSLARPREGFYPGN